MVSHMSAVQVALLFNSYLVHFYSQRNCSFNIMSIQPGKRRFISTGATTWRETQWPGVIGSKRTGGQIDRSGSEAGPMWFWTRHFTLTVPHSIQEYKWIQEKLPGKSDKMSGWDGGRGGMGAGMGWGQGFTGNGLTFYSDEKAILRLCESPLSS